MSDAISYSLLALGCTIQLLAVLGLAIGRDHFDRLHLSAPAIPGAMLVALAVLVRESFSLIGWKALLLAAFFAFSGPLISHLIGRSIRIAEQGDWRIARGERIEIER